MDEIGAKFDEIRESYQGTGYDEDLSHEDLIVTIVALRWLIRQCVMQILYLKAGWIPFEERCRRATRISEAGDDNDWQSLYRLHGDIRPIRHIILWNCALKDLNFQIFLRLRNKPVGSLILRAETNNSSPESDSSLVREFRRILIRNEDLKSYRPQEYESDDLMNEAWLNLWQRRKNASRTCKVSSPFKLPSLPLNLGFHISYRRSNTLQREIDHAIRMWVPCLRGDFEKLRPRKGRMSPLIKNFFAKQKTQKRTAGQFVLKDVDSEQIVEFDTYEDIETHLARVQRILPISVGDSFWLAVHNIKREFSRKKVLQVVELLFKGLTVTDACQLVSITPRTFRNNIPSQLRSQIISSCRCR